MKRRKMTLKMRFWIGAAVCGVLILSGRSLISVRKAPKAPLTLPSAALRGPTGPGSASVPHSSLTLEQREALLTKFSPGVQQLERQVSEDYRVYQADYGRYLELRDLYVQAIVNAHHDGAGKRDLGLSEMSAELDSVLVSLKSRSEQIARRTASLNKSILAEYEAKRPQ